MKMMAGAWLRACSNRSRTRAAPTPTKSSMNSEPLIEKKATPASPATARASRVLPVPVGPISRMPLGTRAPSRPCSAGFFRKSTTSCSSALASSTPATSANRTPVCVSMYTRARLRPMPSNPPPAPMRSDNRRLTRYHSPKKMALGSSQESRSRNQTGSDTRR